MRSKQPSAVRSDIAVRTTVASTSSVSKNSSSVASATDPPRGTMASPNTVMMIEPVREGSCLSWSMMRASGCGGMFYAYRVSGILENARCGPHPSRRRFAAPQDEGIDQSPGLNPHGEEARSAFSNHEAQKILPVRIGIHDRAPAGAVERLPLPFSLREAIGNRIDHRGMMAHAAMAALDLDALGLCRRLLHAALPGADAVGAAVDRRGRHRRRHRQRAAEARVFL